MNPEKLQEGEETDSTEPGSCRGLSSMRTAWMSSTTVNGMTLNQQAIYVRILCGIHMYGKLPRDPWHLAKLIGTHIQIHCTLDAVLLSSDSRCAVKRQ